MNTFMQYRNGVTVVDIEYGHVCPSVITEDYPSGC